MTVNGVDLTILHPGEGTREGEFLVGLVDEMLLGSIKPTGMKVCRPAQKKPFKGRGPKHGDIVASFEARYNAPIAIDKAVDVAVTEVTIL